MSNLVIFTSHKNGKRVALDKTEVKVVYEQVLEENGKQVFVVSLTLKDGNVYEVNGIFDDVILALRKE